MEAVSLLDREAEQQQSLAEEFRQQEIEYLRLQMSRRAELERQLAEINERIERKQKAFERAAHKINDEISMLDAMRFAIRSELRDAKTARQRLLELASPAQRERRERLMNEITDAQAEVQQLRQAAEDARQTAATAPARFASHVRSAELVRRAEQNAETVERRYQQAVERLDTLRRELADTEYEIIHGVKSAE